MMAAPQLERRDPVPALHLEEGIALSPPPCRLQRARPSDAVAIAEVIRPHAERGLMLPRSESAIRRAIRQYRVARSGAGQVVGCIGIRPFHAELAEMVGFAVSEEWQGRGVGTELLVQAVDEALLRGFSRVFAMTLRPGPFLRMGFREVSRELVPEKIRRDCTGCPFRVGCEERTLLLDVGIR